MYLAIFFSLFVAFKRFTRYGRCIIADCYVCRCDLSIQHNDLFRTLFAKIVDLRHMFRSTVTFRAIT